jgi:hypothetical protein
MMSDSLPEARDSDSDAAVRMSTVTGCVPGRWHVFKFTASSLRLLQLDVTVTVAAECTAGDGSRPRKPHSAVPVSA